MGFLIVLRLYNSCMDGILLDISQRFEKTQEEEYAEDRIANRAIHRSHNVCFIDSH